METNTNDLIEVTVKVNGKAFLVRSVTINSDADLARFNEELNRTLGMITADRISRWYPNKGI